MNNYNDDYFNIEPYNVVEHTIKSIQHKTNCNYETAKEIYKMCANTAMGRA